MKVYEFGKKSAPALLLLPGTCCHWKGNFGRVIPLLEKDFRVLCVSYDGFDETENTEFPTMLEETEKIEAYIKEHCSGHIHGAYGCSLGGLLWACWRRGKTSTWIMAFWAAPIWINRRLPPQNYRRRCSCPCSIPSSGMESSKAVSCKKSFKNAWGRRKPMCRRLWTCWAAGGLM